jgi:isocitrate dehydrogenase (NAD+)
MTHTITLIPGDGIGPEVTAAARAVLDAAGVAIRWDVRLAGAAAEETLGTPCPDELVHAIQQHRIALMGPVQAPSGRRMRPVRATLGAALDLYACVQPTRTLPGVPSRFDGVDLVLVAEDTEGLRAGIEHRVVPGVAEAVKIVTERASTRIAEFAFRHARAHGRGAVSLAHRANVLRTSDGLLLDCFRRVAARHPGIEAREVTADACAMALARAPEGFDVLVTDSLHGDLFGALSAGLVGGPGVVARGRFGDEFAVFEAAHGPAMDIAGTGVANPTAMILSATMLLKTLGERAAAARVEAAIHAVYARDLARTPDVGGTSTTDAFTRAVIHALG